MNSNQSEKQINHHKDLNPRPRLSNVDVLTTTPSGRPHNNAAELEALWLTGLPNKF